MAAGDCSPAARGQLGCRLTSSSLVDNPTPLDPDVVARVRLKLEVGNHFFRNEGFTVDLFPTLVLGGELDPITPVADSQDIAAAIPQVELRIFEGAGHGVFRDKPEEAVAVIASSSCAEAGPSRRSARARS
jgi:pimeloyl-ACP methyl ester carboxylesterase